MRHCVTLRTACGRTLVAHILIHCDAVNGRDIWDDFKDAMAEDHQKNIGRQNDAHYSMTLKDISNVLARIGATTEDYGLPLPGDVNILHLHQKR